MHLLFYDGACGLCDHAVQFVLWADKKEQFVFAPLQGSTAKSFIKKLPPECRDADSLILVENYQLPSQQFAILGKGALRICWLLGLPWSLIGWISYLPSFLYNWIYRLVARNRKSLFSEEKCFVPTPKNKKRFLP